MFNSKKLLAALFALTFSCCGALAQIPVTGAGSSGAGGGPTAPPVDQACVTGAGTTITFTSKNFGAANPTRVTAVSVNWADTTAAGTAELTNVTIGGVAAVRAVRAVGDNQNSNSEIWYLLNPTGTTGNVVVTSSTNIDAVTITIYALNGYGSPTVTSTGTTTASNAYTNKTVTLAAASRRVNVSTSLSNMTNDFSSTCGTGLWGVHASQPNNGSGTLSTTISPTSNTPLIAMATWTSCPNNTVCDPYFNNVIVVASFELAQCSSTSYTEQSLFARVMTTSTTCNNNASSQSNISSTQAEYGSASLRSNNTTSATFASSADFGNLALTPTSQYTIEYSLYQSDTASNYDVYNGGHLFTRFNCGSAAIQYFWTPAVGGQVFNPFALTCVANTWVKWAFTKDAGGTIRAFRNGTLISSVTPADATIGPITGGLTVNPAGPGQTSFLDNLRVTTGIARYLATYTPATAAFPIQ